MDPVSIGLALLLKNPQVLLAAASVAGVVAAPAAVDIAKMQGSIADLSKGVLLCYHKTARFHLSDVVQAPRPSAKPIRGREFGQCCASSTRG